MRERRLAKSLSRADLAIQDGNLTEARRALDDVARLDPMCAEAAILRQRLIEQSRRSSFVELLSTRRLPAPVSAIGLLVGAAGLVFGASYWSAVRSQGTAPASAAIGPVGSSALPAGDVPTPAPAAVERLRVVRETIVAPVATPRIVEDLPGLPTGRPIAKAAPEPAAAVAAAPRSLIPSASVPAPGTKVPLESVPPVAPTSNPATSTARAEPERAAPAVDREPPPNTEPAAGRTARPTEPARPAESPTQDESSLVLGVLQRYELAYSRLDAAAAADVWPRVNRNALARAFEGLDSQRVSLGQCDVAVNGPAARATCSGSATWKPKVGGGQRTEPRHWDFELRKTGNGWRIERAVAGSSSH